MKVSAFSSDRSSVTAWASSIFANDKFTPIVFTTASQKEKYLLTGCDGYKSQNNIMITQGQVVEIGVDVQSHDKNSLVDDMWEKYGDFITIVVQLSHSGESNLLRESTTLEQTMSTTTPKESSHMHWQKTSRGIFISTTTVFCVDQMFTNIPILLSVSVSCNLTPEGGNIIENIGWEIPDKISIMDIGVRKVPRTITKEFNLNITIIEPIKINTWSRALGTHECLLGFTITNNHPHNSIIIEDTILQVNDSKVFGLPAQNNPDSSQTEKWTVMKTGSETSRFSVTANHNLIADRTIRSNAIFAGSFPGRVPLVAGTGHSSLIPLTYDPSSIITDSNFNLESLFCATWLGKSSTRLTSRTFPQTHTSSPGTAPEENSDAAHRWIRPMESFTFIARVSLKETSLPVALLDTSEILQSQIAEGTVRKLNFNMIRSPTMVVVPVEHPQSPETVPTTANFSIKGTPLTPAADKILRESSSKSVLNESTRSARKILPPTQGDVGLAPTDMASTRVGVTGCDATSSWMVHSPYTIRWREDVRPIPPNQMRRLPASQRKSGNAPTGPAADRQMYGRYLWVDSIPWEISPMWFQRFWRMAEVSARNGGGEINHRDVEASDIHVEVTGPRTVHTRTPFTLQVRVKNYSKSVMKLSVCLDDVDGVVQTEKQEQGVLGEDHALDKSANLIIFSTTGALNMSSSNDPASPSTANEIEAPDGYSASPVAQFVTLESTMHLTEVNPGETTKSELTVFPLTVGRFRLQNYFITDDRDRGVLSQKYFLLHPYEALVLD